MLYPLLLKRIASRIKGAYEDFLINKENVRNYSEYSAWLAEYLSLSDEDIKNVLTKFERSQTASIIYAMRRKDKEIFINQLGVFYIKPTTIDYYNALDRMIGDKDKSEYDFEQVKKSALEECRELYIKRANAKKNAKKSINFSFKI